MGLLHKLSNGIHHRNSHIYKIYDNRDNAKAHKMSILDSVYRFKEFNSKSDRTCVFCRLVCVSQSERSF